MFIPASGPKNSYTGWVRFNLSILNQNISLTAAIQINRPVFLANNIIMIMMGIIVNFNHIHLKKDFAIPESVASSITHLS